MHGPQFRFPQNRAGERCMPRQRSTTYSTMNKNKEKNLLDRATAPTPKFFRTLRNIGLSLLAASGAILTAPVSIPAALITAATYAAVAGGVLSAVAQVTVEQE